VDRQEGRLRSRPRVDLPVQASSFVGRDRELVELEGMMASSRLLTLTGPGGCGKTRLALQAAANLAEDFEDDIGFVELAPSPPPNSWPRRRRGR
jgi:MoxR-like ATPase